MFLMTGTHRDKVESQVTTHIQIQWLLCSELLEIVSLNTNIVDYSCHKQHRQCLDICDQEAHVRI